jgi:hypothetical protein
MYNVGPFKFIPLTSLDKVDRPRLGMCFKIFSLYGYIRMLTKIFTNGVQQQASSPLKDRQDTRSRGTVEISIN